MIKINPEKPETKAATDGPKSGENDAVAKAEAARKQRLADEVEVFCADLERTFRRAYGEVPKASDLGELRAQQSTIRELVSRAAGMGENADSNPAVVQALTEERDKLKDSAVRARADFLNYQNRAAKDLERAEELALRRYVQELLPILDSLDLARNDAAGPQADAQRLKEALEMIATSMGQVLAVRGLERIEAKGKAYDPSFHEAVAKRPPEKDEKPNTVLEELRPGYLWKGLLLRPAQVLVADNKKE
jgi:molecular chaperone GrpE